MSAGVVIEKDITDDEAKLYDRQIRLWGVSSQKRLRQANVICIGLSGLASEIIKNIVLAGINSLTIIDDSKVSEEDTLSNIFTRHEIGKNRGDVAVSNIKILNPMVKISNLHWNIKEKVATEDEELVKLLKSADCVFITNFHPETMISLNDLCHSVADHSVKFFAASDWGFYGFSFTDLGKKYKYLTEEMVQSEIDTEGPAVKKQKTEEVQKKCVEKELDFVPLRAALSAKSGKAGIGITKRTSPVLALTHILFKFCRKMDRYPSNESRSEDVSILKSLKEEVLTELELPNTALKELDEEECFEFIFGEVSPVCAIVGGVLGQDIIRAITNHDAPIRNFFLFDGVKCQGSVESIGK